MFCKNRTVSEVLIRHVIKMENLEYETSRKLLKRQLQEERMTKTICDKMPFLQTHIEIASFVVDEFKKHERRAKSHHLMPVERVAFATTCKTANALRDLPFANMLQKMRRHFHF